MDEIPPRRLILFEEKQFDAWNMVLGSAVDEPVIRRAIFEIKALGGNVTIGADGQVKVDPPHRD